MKGKEYVYYVAGKIADVVVYPRKNMARIVLMLAILSIIELVVSGGDTRLIVGFVELVVLAMIYFAVRQGNSPILTSAVSIAAVASFAIFFWTASFAVGNAWAEKISEMAFIFSVIIVLEMFITYRADMPLKEGSENTGKTGTEE